MDVPTSSETSRDELNSKSKPPVYCHALACPSGKDCRFLHRQPPANKSLVVQHPPHINYMDVKHSDFSNDDGDTDFHSDDDKKLDWSIPHYDDSSPSSGDNEVKQTIQIKKTINVKRRRSYHAKTNRRLKFGASQA